MFYILDEIYEAIDNYIIVTGRNNIYDYGVCGVIEAILDSHTGDYKRKYIKLNETDGIMVVSCGGWLEAFFYRKDLSTFG